MASLTVHTGESRLIPVSWLHTQSYCEYQIKLQYLDHLQGEKSAALTKGIIGHARLDKEFKKKAKPLREPLEDYLPKLAAGKEEPITMRQVKVCSPKFGVIGEIDEAQIYPEAAVIIDDKPGDTAWLSNKRQVWGYCLCFQDQYNWPNKLIAVLRNRDSQQVFWEKEFSEKDEQDVAEAINRLHSLLAGKIDWIPTKKPNKCAACSFKNVCDKSLA